MGNRVQYELDKELNQAHVVVVVRFRISAVGAFLKETKRRSPAMTPCASTEDMSAHCWQTTAHIRTSPLARMPSNTGQSPSHPQPPSRFRNASGLDPTRRTVSNRQQRARNPVCSTGLIVDILNRVDGRQFRGCGGFRRFAQARSGRSEAPELAVAIEEERAGLGRIVALLCSRAAAVSLSRVALSASGSTALATSSTMSLGGEMATDDLSAVRFRCMEFSQTKLAGGLLGGRGAEGGRFRPLQGRSPAYGPIRNLPSGSGRAVSHGLAARALATTFKRKSPRFTT